MNRIKISLLLCVTIFPALLTAQSMESDVTIIRGNDVREPVLIQREMTGSQFAGPGFNAAVNPAMGRANRVFITSAPDTGRLFPPEMIMHNQESLNLTQKQVTAIKDEMRKFQSGIVDIQWDLNEAQTKLAKELGQDRIDEKRALSLAASVTKAENELKRSNLTMLIRIHNVLEPAQLAELEKLNGFHAGVMAMPVPTPHRIMHWQGAP